MWTTNSSAGSLKLHNASPIAIDDESKKTCDMLYSTWNDNIMDFIQTDQGPYAVFVEHMNKNVGRLFPINIGYSLLTDNWLKNYILDATSEGMNGAEVVFQI